MLSNIQALKQTQQIVTKPDHCYSYIVQKVNSYSSCSYIFPCAIFLVFFLIWYTYHIYFFFENKDNTVWLFWNYKFKSKQLHFYFISSLNTFCNTWMLFYCNIVIFVRSITFICACALWLTDCNIHGCSFRCQVSCLTCYTDLIDLSRNQTIKINRRCRIPTI